MLYSFTVSGASVHIHYCMDEFSGLAISLSGEKTSLCGLCGMEEKESGDCCNEEIQKIETDKDQLKKSNDYSFKQVLENQKQSGFTYNSFLQSSVSENYPVSNAPPSEAEISLNILHCNYRI